MSHTNPPTSRTTDTMWGQQHDEYNYAVEDLRDREYPMLKDSVYLDHAGTTMCAKSVMERFALEMVSNLFGNPHSGSSPSQLSTCRIEDTRLRLLQHFGADPSHFDLVFVANATAGVKLVLEAFRAMPQGFLYAHHQACHTSLVGVREEARNCCCLDDLGVQAWAEGRPPFPAQDQQSTAILFAYSAQSHMDGRRYPLSWSQRIRQSHSDPNVSIYTLLDAASLAATSPIELGDSESAPDFVVISLYKIFGFPDLGALIVRRQAESVFDSRKYFGGGTVDMVVCGKEKWHVPKSQFLHERLEDGTLPFHSIVALGTTLDLHRDLFGSMSSIAAHTTFLSCRLRQGLASLRHANGQGVCVLYPPPTERDSPTLDSGPVVSFNIRNDAGAWISLAEFEKLAQLKRIHVRTGGLCSPGGISSALGIEPWEMKRNFSSGLRCGSENDIISGKPTGVIRASLGAMSTLSDVERFLDFIEEFYRDDECRSVDVGPTAGVGNQRISEMRVRSLAVYPIKSCGAYEIPQGRPWEVRPEGLAWDREWCLIHRGTGQALNQKRYPRMALMRPTLDFEGGVLRVTFHGPMPPGQGREISVPLSENPALFRPSTTYQPMRSRVCGDEISAQTYTSDAIHDFFSNALNVPCVLVRFPPGGEGYETRYAKARSAWGSYIKPATAGRIPGSFPSPPSPPESDSEEPRSRILLSNESPILMINALSLATLNDEIRAKGGKPALATAFRANVVLEPAAAGSAEPGYGEDYWTRLRIGQQMFDLLGGCRRCQMVCVDQTSGDKSDEPFVTLAKTRRIGGKVYFGAHMKHRQPTRLDTVQAQYPTIQVGDAVEAEVGVE